MTPTIQSLLNHLLFQSGSVHDLGLFHGKTGIAMALYLYARQTADALVEDCAWELLNDYSYDGVCGFTYYTNGDYTTSVFGCTANTSGSK